MSLVAVSCVFLSATKTDINQVWLERADFCNWVFVGRCSSPLLRCSYIVLSVLIFKTLPSMALRARITFACVTINA